MDGSTTMADAAIMEPQFRMSAPSRVLTATDKVVLSELLTSSKAYRNSFQALIKT